MNSFRSLIHFLFTIALTFAGVASSAAVLSPQFAGKFGVGNGANSSWRQIVPDWRGATFGSEVWGTGIWGLQDANAVAGLSASDSSIVKTFSGRVAKVGFGNELYDSQWAATWGAQPLAPLFAPGDSYQENWIARFSGFIYIPTAGDYNLSVLSDDGFRLDIFGASSMTLAAELDGLNPRTRTAFDEPLQLSEGLYGFQLLSYNRLEVGVVDLSWFRPDGKDWETIPTPNLFTDPTRVSAPSTLLLGSLGVALLGFRRYRRFTFFSRS